MILLRICPAIQLCRRRVPPVAALWFVLFAAFSTGAGSLWAADRLPACVDGIGGDNAPAQAGRSITAEDLATLRDFGGPSPLLTGPAPMEVSPDGTQISLLLRRGDPQSGKYCVSLIVTGTHPGTSPHELDQDDHVIVPKTDSFNFADFTVGYLWELPPQWSPDGRELAYLKQDDAGVGLWIVAAEGGVPHRIAVIPNDVRAFGWSRDGKGVVFTSRPSLAAAQRAITNEGRRGWLYDDRFWPLSSDRPLVRLPLDTQTQHVGIDNGAIRAATADEAGTLRGAAITSIRPGALNAARSSLDGVAWTEKAAPAIFDHRTVLKVRLTGKTRTCESASCAQIVGLWWSRRGDTLYLLNVEGFADSRMALYRWRAAQAVPERLLLTDDLLIGCQMADDRLVCAQEGSIIPRRLVAIDLTNGTIAPLFDPNPEFRTIRLAPATRLTWRNDRGLPVFGDLVLPSNYKSGVSVPLVVTTYQSKGFLRGGTGDEFPVQLFAAHGFAVLSVNHPEPVANLAKPMSVTAFLRDGFEFGAERKSIESAIETGVRLLIDCHIVDPNRIGITGLSDGASSVTFALVNSNLFHAAAVGTCCEAPSNMAVLGPDHLERMTEAGYPRTEADNPAFWNRLSLKTAAAEIQTPLLIQASSDEFRMALDTWTELVAHERPVEMYVFPDEHHIKWHPDHKLAIYKRSVAWFEFWLRGISDPDLATEDEFHRWRIMREREKRAINAPIRP